MKPLYYLLATACLCLSIVSVSGQDTPSTRNFDFFAKGENSYTLGEKAYYGRMVYTFNDQKFSRSNSTYFDIDWNHWFGGLGAGLKVSADWSGTHYYNNNTDQLYRDWSISPSLAYGKTISDNLGVYVRGNVLYGKGKDIYKSPSITNTDKSDLFGYGGHIGFPYRFSGYTALTAELGYDHLQTKYDGSKEDENSYGINLFLEDYRRCNQLKCDYHNGFKFSKNEYQQGDAFINYETAIGYNAGNSKQTYTNPSYTYKNKFNSFDADLNGSYYIIDGISLGGRLNIGRSQQKSDDNTFSNTYNFLRFDPEAIIHVPVDNGWRNVFIKGGGYFGSEKSETKSGMITNSDKYGLTGFNVGAGFYTFFSEQTAVQTCVYHRSLTYNDKNSDDKARYKGIGVSVGLVHSFGN